jgi:hypothetical protein
MTSLQGKKKVLSLQYEGEKKKKKEENWRKERKKTTAKDR